ncbi:MAG: NADH-quinone oxidoreductase subunit N [Prevotella sp.]|nr:NADH-quinone oxidoreductase subunit N [Prevotella sp.]MBQ9670733.1 NADH-quinone oxidoreductase subunit N [Prevotella sp.]MDY6230148.1 NADH-quinone oxidoreductase subunit N [Prevotella sp.]MDY6409215.1 NADH-quinone oxidoreductase subunit N [Prevotella sp.]
MNYSQFLNMIPEAMLVAILIIVFIADFASSKSNERKWFNPLVSLLMFAEFVLSFFCMEPTEAFGGMYVTSEAANIMKIVLSMGTIIVLVMSRTWIYGKHNVAEIDRMKTFDRHEGEFYMLVVSTLLGMNMMVSAGHYLMFFLGLEMASVPMACMVALDKYRNNSAEGAAKYILTATFSSGIMLFGLTFVYAACGTLYFDDVADTLTISPIMIMGLVFFFSGLGFKISLVPFHFWTADTYQGAPTVVTAYLSVVSKGAAAFALLASFMKTFGPMTEYWQQMLYVVIVLSITVANLFAIRQSELKRFMAFSSISQAGYIMLAVVGANTLGIAALTYYVLVYVVANLSVFAVINAVEQNNAGATDMSAYNGFYRTNPKLAFLMTVALFSLAGIPPFAGMFSKFFVFMAATESMSSVAYIVVFIALLNTVVSLYYYLLIVKAMYIKGSDNPLPTFRSDAYTKIALAVCTAGIMLFGVLSCIYEWIYEGAII